ncbi:MAG: cbb3-type cytochrome c oxidase subunit I [Candidatus Thiodiazotropha sp.]
MSVEARSLDLQELTPDQGGMLRRWLQLGVLALGLAGLFAVLLVVSRMPGSEAFFPWIDFFHTALVVHVDQSVLIWFLAMAGLSGALLSPSEPLMKSAQALAFALCLSGTLGIALSAFVGEGAPLMNNYVPVLQRPLFFGMLGVFAAGIGLQTLLTLRGAWLSLRRDPLNLPAWAAITISVAVLLALVAVFTAKWQMPEGVSGQSYYEYLFWGAGHTLQFAYTQLVMLAWLLLARHGGLQLPGRGAWYAGLFLIGELPVLGTPIIYLMHSTVSIESRSAFTHLMQYGGGLAVVPLGLLVIGSLYRAPTADPAQRPLRRALVMSMVLFFSGGLIALFISGLNTIIPAHYHGSIVGITLALMGMAYLLLPRLGYPVVSGRLADWQPWIYGFGQLLHIGGLAVSGAMGIQRKTAGAAQGLDSLSAKAAMGVMGLGGLLAVIGGFLFVWIMLRAFFNARPTRGEEH